MVGQSDRTTQGNKTARIRKGQYSSRPRNGRDKKTTRQDLKQDTNERLFQTRLDQGNIPCVYSAVTATGDGPLDEGFWPITLGPSPGWRTPSAAPNILFPGSPILGGLPTLSEVSIGPPIARMAGSEGTSSRFGELNWDEMSEFNVG